MPSCFVSAVGGGQTSSEAYRGSGGDGVAAPASSWEVGIQ